MWILQLNSGQVSRYEAPDKCTETVNLIAKSEDNNSDSIVKQALVGVDTDIAILSSLLPNLSVVFFRFNQFADGRGFSIARLLKQTYGFTGELCAIGHVIPDQFQYLQRCGFDSVEISRYPSLQQDGSKWADMVGAFSSAYQSAHDPAESILIK